MARHRAGLAGRGRAQAAPEPAVRKAYRGAAPATAWRDLRRLSGCLPDPGLRLIQATREPIKALPLGMVLKACPEINDYGPGGVVGSWARS
ncbi:hypothetical protein I6F11_24200 [Ensifer sp. NBAIM29]|nr:hypothetical protein [Ensifer sp. NBAIM29]